MKGTDQCNTLNLTQRLFCVLPFFYFAGIDIREWLRTRPVDFKSLRVARVSRFYVSFTDFGTFYFSKFLSPFGLFYKLSLFCFEKIFENNDE